MYLLIGEEIERATCLILDGSKLSNVNKCTDFGLGRTEERETCLAKRDHNRRSMTR